jgi:hypothetical protein
MYRLNTLSPVHNAGASSPLNFEHFTPPHDAYLQVICCGEEPPPSVLEFYDRDEETISGITLMTRKLLIYPGTVITRITIKISRFMCQFM